MKVIVDGQDEYGNWTGGPEARAPWAVFDPDAQDNLVVNLRWRWQAVLYAWWVNLWRVP